MTRQKPPNPTGELTGFPYDDLWEEFGAPEKRLYDHGVDRQRIDDAFTKARELGAKEFGLTRIEIFRTLALLNIPPLQLRRLAQLLYYLAGHYYSPRFHRLFGDDPARARGRLKGVASTASKLERLMDGLTPSLWRQVGAARWSLRSARRGSPSLDWARLQDYVADLAASSQRVAEEFPQFGRGTTEKVLLGRWLRQSAEAIERAAGQQIITKSSDSAGENFRFENLEGGVFEAYCQLVDRSVAVKTMVRAVQDYHRHGIAGSPPK